MTFKPETLVHDIIESHEKRIGTLELILQGFLVFICIRKILTLTLEKVNRLAKHV